jgi:hypothetical protein
MLYDLKTGALRALATAKAPYSEGALDHYVVAGQVNGAYAVWERNSYGALGLRSSNVVRLNIRRNATKTLPRPSHTLQESPAVSSDGTVYFAGVSKRDGTARIVKKPIGAPAQVLYSQGGRDLYVDDRAKARHVYFAFRDGSTPYIYKLIDPLPSP